MKKLFLIASLTSGFLMFSCDKVENSLKKEGATGIDWSLYPGGDSTTYVQAGLWPTFTDNTNTLRNVLIEDFTGHLCVFCPLTASAVHAFTDTTSTRAFDVAIHSGSEGGGGLANSFQALEAPNFTEVFFNDEGLDIGEYFGDIPGTGFTSNPRLTINRIKQGNDPTCSAASISTLSNAVFGSQLKVNIQASSNYFVTTRGIFLHTEIDKLDQTLTSDLFTVVYLVEDSIIAPQKISSPQFPSGVIMDYVHRNVMRGCLDKKPFGQRLSTSSLNTNGKHYFNYSFKLPNQYTIDNMHLLIYVYDKSTEEILQVIKHHL